MVGSRRYIKEQTRFVITIIFIFDPFEGNFDQWEPVFHRSVSIDSREIYSYLKWKQKKKKRERERKTTV